MTTSQATGCQADYLSSLTTCPTCQPVQPVNLSNLSTCQPVNLSTCPTCQPVNLPQPVNLLLVPQRIHRIDPRGPQGRNESGPHRHQCQRDRRDNQDDRIGA